MVSRLSNGGGEPSGAMTVTPLVLLALELEHGIICIDILFCLLHLDCTLGKISKQV
jgi:hypothetical protein